MENVSFCLVRTGHAEVQMDILDESGQSIASKSVSMKQAKLWHSQEINPGTQNNTYTLKVSALTYAKGDSAFRIMVGSTSNLEKMMSGKENAVPIDRYYESKLNFLGSSYTPNQEEFWVKFTAHKDDAITVLLRDSNIRLKIFDEAHTADGEEIIDTDSSDYAGAHRTRNVGTWSCAEKIRQSENEEIVPGKTYYLVLYKIKDKQTSVFVEKTFDVAVGNPMMASGNTTISPRQRVTVNNKSFSTNVTAQITEDVPSTAVLREIRYSGTRASNILTFRAQKVGESWKSSKSYYTNIDYTYTKDSSYNMKAQGNWNFSFKAASTKTSVTFTPSFKLYYYYEYGD